MSHLTFRTSKPCPWILPRQRDAREMTHGKILPMEQEGWAIAHFMRTALAGFALRPLRVLRRAGACRYRGGRL